MSSMAPKIIRNGTAATGLRRILDRYVKRRIVVISIVTVMARP